jgi:hypothetical protein
MEPKVTNPSVSCGAAAAVAGQYLAELPAELGYLTWLLLVE